MCCKGFSKRILPFFLTFAVGLLIASFFVSITPNFKFERAGWSRHRAYHQRLEFENQRLREENNMLKRQALEIRTLPPAPPVIDDIDSFDEPRLAPPVKSVPKAVKKYDVLH
jgi:hypothetical protein